MSNRIKTSRAALAVAMAAALAALAPAGAASAQQRFGSGVLNCDAPGGRQRAGAAIGALIGGLVGSRVAENERTLGAVAGAGLGAAAGSYIGCNQQRGRVAAQGYDQASTTSLRTTSNLRVRSGPGTGYGQVGSLGAGQQVQAVNAQGDWVQLADGGWVSGRYLTY